MLLGTCTSSGLHTFTFALHTFTFHVGSYLITNHHSLKLNDNDLTISLPDRPKLVTLLFYSVCLWVGKG